MAWLGLYRADVASPLCPQAYSRSSRSEVRHIPAVAVGLAWSA